LKRNEISKLDFLELCGRLAKKKRMENALTLESKRLNAKNGGLERKLRHMYETQDKLIVAAVGVHLSGNWFRSFYPRHRPIELPCIVTMNGPYMRPRDDFVSAISGSLQRISSLDVAQMLENFASAFSYMELFFHEMRSRGCALSCFPLDTVDSLVDREFPEDIARLLHEFAQNFSIFLNPCDRTPFADRHFSPFFQQLVESSDTSHIITDDPQNTPYMVLFQYLAHVCQGVLVVDFQKYFDTMTACNTPSNLSHMYVLVRFVDNDTDLIRLEAYVSPVFDGDDYNDLYQLFVNADYGVVNPYVAKLAPGAYFGDGITIQDAANLAAHRKVARTRYKLNKEEVLPFLPDEIWNKINLFAIQSPSV
jgi:hypothetical protein